MESYSDDNSENESKSCEKSVKKSPTKLQKLKTSSEAHGVKADKKSSKKSSVKQLKKKDCKKLGEAVKKQLLQNTWKVDYFSSEDDVFDGPDPGNIKTEQFSSGDEGETVAPPIPQTTGSLKKGKKKNSFNSDDDETIVSNNKVISFNPYADDQDDDEGVVSKKTSKERKIFTKKEIVSSDDDDETQNRPDIDEPVDDVVVNRKNELPEFKSSIPEASDSASESEIQPSQYWLSRYNKLAEKDDEKGSIKTTEKSSPKKNASVKKEKLLLDDESSCDRLPRRKSPPRITKSEIVSTKYKRTDNKITKVEEEIDSGIDTKKKTDIGKRFNSLRSSSDDNNDDDDEKITEEIKSNEDKSSVDEDKESEKEISPKKKRLSLKKEQASPERKPSLKTKKLDLNSVTKRNRNTNKKSPSKKNLNNKSNVEPLKPRESICDADTSSEEEREPEEMKEDSSKSSFYVAELKNSSKNSPKTKLKQSILAQNGNGEISLRTESIIPRKEPSRKSSISDRSPVKDKTSSEDSFAEAAPSPPIKKKVSPKTKKVDSNDSEDSEVTESQERETNDEVRRSSESPLKRKLESSTDIKIPAQRKRSEVDSPETKSSKRAKLTDSSELDDRPPTSDDSDDTDTLTKLNTTINKSMAFMDNKSNGIGIAKLSKGRKSVSINTKVNLEHSLNDSKAQKSILKKPEQSSTAEDNENVDRNDKNVRQIKPTTKIIKRPINLKNLKEQESLADDSTKASFGLDDISDDDEIYLIDVPKTIDPKQLRGRTMKLGGKNKLQIEDQLYETWDKEPINISCVFRTDNEESVYKIVNVRPAGWINVRQRLSKNSHAELSTVEKSIVPFPENLKTRHPLFGAEYEEKIVVADKVSPKRTVKKAASFQKANESTETDKIGIRSKSVQEKSKKMKIENQSMNKLKTSRKKVSSNNSSDSDSDGGFFRKVKRESIDSNKKRKKSNNNSSSILNETPELDLEDVVKSDKRKGLSVIKKLGSSLNSFKNSSFDINTKNSQFFSSTPIKTEKINETSDDELSSNKIKKRKNYNDGTRLTKSPKKLKTN